MDQIGRQGWRLRRFGAGAVAVGIAVAINVLLAAGLWLDHDRLLNDAARRAADQAAVYAALVAEALGQGQMVLGQATPAMAPGGAVVAWFQLGPDGRVRGDGDPGVSGRRLQVPFTAVTGNPVIGGADWLGGGFGSSAVSLAEPAADGGWRIVVVDLAPATERMRAAPGMIDAAVMLRQGSGLVVLGGADQTGLAIAAGIAGGGTVESVLVEAMAGGQPVLVATRPLASLPLVTVIALSRAEILAPWRQRLLVAVAVGGLASLALVGLGLAADRRWRAWEQVSGLLADRGGRRREIAAARRALLQALPVAACLVDAHGRVLGSNHALVCLLGVSSEHLAGQTLADAGLGALTPALEAEILEDVDLNGTRVDVAAAPPPEGGRGRLIMIWAAAARTALAEALAESRQAGERLSRELAETRQHLEIARRTARPAQMISGVAREVDAPMAVILAGVRQLDQEAQRLDRLRQADTLNATDMAAFVGQVQDASRLMGAQLERLVLLLSGLRQVGGDGTVQSFPPGPFLDDLNHRLAALLNRAGVSLVVRADADQAVATDPAWLARQVVALVVAAAGAGGGALDLTLRGGGAAAVLVIEGETGILDAAAGVMDDDRLTRPAAGELVLALASDKD